MADQCIVCLENLDVAPHLQPALVAVHDDGGDVARVTIAESAPANAETAEIAGAAGTVVARSASVPEPAAALAADLSDCNGVANGVAVTKASSSVVLCTSSDQFEPDSQIAEIDICGHVLHNTCLRAWTGKANSCPICRQNFHTVNVYDQVGGAKLYSYKVEDKKQVAEFDAQAWLDENPEDDEPARPCPICNRNDHEEVLLLCDSCDASYHTHCLGLDSVPRGHWFCLECAQEGAELAAAAIASPSLADSGRLAGSSSIQGPSDFMPRTRASMRRVRRRNRSDEWQGAWGQIAGRVYDALGFDLDYHDDDDEALQNYRRAQQRRDREQLDYARWQQRFNIASRLGARDVFANNLSQAPPQSIPPPIVPIMAHHLVQPRRPPLPSLPSLASSAHASASITASTSATAHADSPDVRRAWGAMERALEVVTSGESGVANSRKRRSRSITAPSGEVRPEPERRLKRPRTRRIITQNENEGSSAFPLALASPIESSAMMPIGGDGEPSLSLVPVLPPQSPPVAMAPPGTEPSFLSSLLKEVEMSTPSDDDTIRKLINTTRTGGDAVSPPVSPTGSGHSSPRALSVTPPPRSLVERVGSPLPLSSHIEPVYLPANYSPNYSPNRAGGDNSDSDSGGRCHRGSHHHRQQVRQRRDSRATSHSPTLPGPTSTLEIRQPRPRRQEGSTNHVRSMRSPESSPNRGSLLSLETKEKISAIIKNALKPHYKSGSINAEQYTSINRGLSRKLYNELSGGQLDDTARYRCEKIAIKEVDRAVASLPKAEASASPKF